MEFTQNLIFRHQLADVHESGRKDNIKNKLIGFHWLRIGSIGGLLLRR
jgi:hypothetical protein